MEEDLLNFITQGVENINVLKDMDWDTDVSNNDNTLIIYTNDVRRIKNIYIKYETYRTFLIIDDKVKLYLKDLLINQAIYLIPTDIQTYNNILNNKKIKNPLTIPLCLTKNNPVSKTYLGKELINNMSDIRITPLLNFKMNISLSTENSNNYIYETLDSLKQIINSLDLGQIKNNMIIKYKKNQIYYDLNKVKNYTSLQNNIQNCTLQRCMGFARGYRGFMKNYRIIYIKNYSYHELSKTYTMKRGINYIWVREGAEIYDFKNILRNYYIDVAFKGHLTMSFLINSKTDKEPMLITRCNRRDKQKSYNVIIKNINHISEMVVGHNDRKLDEFNTIKLYWIYGNMKLWSYFFPLNKLHLEYLSFAIDNEFIEKNEINEHFYINYDKSMKMDLKKFKRIIAFQYGLENKELGNYSNKILTFLIKNISYFKIEKILIITKIIAGYGGNQKTARQMYDNLTKYYNVDILSLVPSRRDKFNFKIDMRCDNDIHNLDIIKIKRYGKMVEHINNENYIKIINNKWNELKNINHLLNKRIDYLTHNNNDPFNNCIIENQKYINNIFTINNIHKEILQRRGIKNEIKQYINHIEGNNYYNHDNDKFKYNIVFIGRLSKEKNINTLLDAFKRIQKIIPKLNLYILGDGSNEYYKDYENVHYFGKVDFEKVTAILLKCDYTILTSISEGVPFTILESMSMGVPIISTNINGVNEYVKNKETGFLCDIVDYNKRMYDLGSWDILDIVKKNKEENIKNIAHAIARAYSININKWHEMSKNCYGLMRKHFKNNADTINKKNLLE